MEWQTVEIKKLKRFSTKELKEKKETLKIRAYDHYMLNAGYKVINREKEVIGYITFNQFMKCDTSIVKKSYGYREYVIL